MKENTLLPQIAFLVIFLIFAPPVAAWFRWRKKSEVWRQGSVLLCLFTSWLGYVILVAVQSYLEGRDEAGK